MKFVADFRKFIKQEVNLNSSRLEKLQSRVDSVSEYIATDSAFSDIYLDVIPSGSWAYGTIIKPVHESDEFDADILLFLKEEASWQPKDYIENLYLAFQRRNIYKDKAH